jgi:hypothetical protein
VTTEPVVLGLDVSPLRMGWGLVSAENGRPIACGCFDANLTRNGWNLLPIRAALAGVFARFLADGAVQVLAVYREAPWFGESTGHKGPMEMGRAIGAVDAYATDLTLRRIRELQPSTWRSKAGVPRKGTMHYGSIADAVDPPWPTRDAAKPEVYVRALTLGFDPEGRQDAADAACIAVAGQVMEANAADYAARLQAHADRLA